MEDSPWNIEEGRKGETNSLEVTHQEASVATKTECNLGLQDLLNDI
jgi:hypothetical protein